MISFFIHSIFIVYLQMGKIVFNKFADETRWCWVACMGRMLPPAKWANSFRSPAWFFVFVYVATQTLTSTDAISWELIYQDLFCFLLWLESFLSTNWFCTISDERTQRGKLFTNKIDENNGTFKYGRFYFLVIIMLTLIAQKVRVEFSTYHNHFFTWRFKAQKSSRNEKNLCMQPVAINLTVKKLLNK